MIYTAAPWAGQFWGPLRGWRSWVSRAKPIFYGHRGPGCCCCFDERPEDGEGRSQNDSRGKQDTKFMSCHSYQEHTHTDESRFELELGLLPVQNKFGRRKLVYLTWSGDGFSPLVEWPAGATHSGWFVDKIVLFFIIHCFFLCSLFIVHWSLVVGHWSLVIGH